MGMSSKNTLCILGLRTPSICTHRLHMAPLWAGRHHDHSGLHLRADTLKRRPWLACAALLYTAMLSRLLDADMQQGQDTAGGQLRSACPGAAPLVLVSSTWNRRRRLSRPAVSSSWPLGWNSTDRTTDALGSALLASASGVTCRNRWILFGWESQ